MSMEFNPLQKVWLKMTKKIKSLTYGFDRKDIRIKKGNQKILQSVKNGKIVFFKSVVSLFENEILLLMAMWMSNLKR